MKSDPKKKKKKPIDIFKIGMAEDIELDVSFKAPREANALSRHFDAHNGDFDTPEEFIRAYLSHDRRALATLGVQNMELLRDALEKMCPDIREAMREETTTPRRMREYLHQLMHKDKPEIF